MSFCDFIHQYELVNIQQKWISQQDTDGNDRNIDSNIFFSIVQEHPPHYMVMIKKYNFSCISCCNLIPSTTDIHVTSQEKYTGVKLKWGNIQQ